MEPASTSPAGSRSAAPARDRPASGRVPATRLPQQDRAGAAATRSGSGPTSTRLAVLLGLGIALLGVLGVLAVHFPRQVPWVLDLDAEHSVPALYSGLLLVAGGAAFLVLSRAGAGLPAALLALLLGFMSLDEVVVVHEKLEAATGVDWQLLYAPLFLLCGVGWLLVLRRFGLRSAAGVLLVGGAALWAGSQVLEQIQWDGVAEVAHYRWYAVPEELAEMGGSLLFLLAACARAGSPRALVDLARRPR